MNKKINLLLGTLMVGMVSTVALNVAVLAKNQEAIALIQSANDDKSKKATTEDNVTIAEHYVIRSTKAISDAYKSGDTSKLTDKEKETLDMASDILSKIIKDGMTDYEKEKAVFDWMVENLGNDQGLLTVIPTSQSESDNPYGVLKNKNAVCVGYATTFRLFMQMMDIETMVIHNNDNYHSWDLVKLDGEWYHTDVYNAVNSGGYEYFNFNDAVLSSTQTWDTEFFPASTGIKYNMAYQNREKSDDIYAIPAKVRELISQNGGMAAMEFGPELTEEQAGVVNYMVKQIEESLWSTPEYASASITARWSKIDEGYLLSIFAQTGKEESGMSIADEDVSKVENAIQNAFGDLYGQEPILDGDANGFDDGSAVVKEMQ